MQSPRWTCGLCRWQTVQIHIVTNKNGAECVKWKYTRTTHKFLLHRWMLPPEDSYSDLMGLRRLSSVPPGFLHAFFPLKSDSQTKYKAILCAQKCARVNCIKERCLYSPCSTIWILQKLVLLKQTFPKTDLWIPSTVGWLREIWVSHRSQAIPVVREYFSTHWYQTYYLENIYTG